MYNSSKFEIIALLSGIIGLIEKETTELQRDVIDRVKQKIFKKVFHQAHINNAANINNTKSVEQSIYEG